ncbi:MAG TPA: metallophosphatase domain-containing protein [Elusimicrobiota bacterium]|nr:metallophosphatase domain-containing protein [Elusimicrobiota bacterium]
MRFVCVSDTHTMHDRLPIPEGDVFIHAGDMTDVGSPILLTHGPPLGHGDDIPSYGKTERVGCADLLAAVERIKPKYHIFGHVHEGYGITKNEHTAFINASMCDAAYNPTNPAIVFDWTKAAVSR